MSTRIYSAGRLYATHLEYDMDVDPLLDRIKYLDLDAMKTGDPAQLRAAAEIFTSTPEMKQRYVKAVDDYLETCAKLNNPRRKFIRNTSYIVLGGGLSVTALGGMVTLRANSDKNIAERELKEGAQSNDQSPEEIWRWAKVYLNAEKNQKTGLVVAGAGAAASLISSAAIRYDGKTIKEMEKVFTLEEKQLLVAYAIDAFSMGLANNIQEAAKLKLPSHEFLKDEGPSAGAKR